MTPAAQIMNALAEVFAPMDVRVTAESIEWAKGRRAAIREFSANATREERRDQWGYYGKLHALAGGKTWYNALNGRNDAMIEEFMTKNCAATAEARNANIAAKLAKAGVTEVTETTFTQTKDGFNGTFVVMTDAGRKVVTVNTIFAGGYNIQCLHLRVLTRVR